MPNDLTGYVLASASSTGTKRLRESSVSIIYSRLLDKSPDFTAYAKTCLQDSATLPLGTSSFFCRWCKIILLQWRHCLCRAGLTS